MEKISEEEYTVILDSTQQINQVILNVLAELLIYESGIIQLLSFHNERFNFKQTVQTLEKDSERLSIEVSQIKQRVKLVQCNSIQIEDILASLSEIKKNDLVVLLGGERLFNSLKGEGIFVKQYSDMSFRSFQQEQLPWQEIVDNIHEIHNNLLSQVQKFICVITTEKSCFVKITELFQAIEEPEIFYIGMENDNSAEIHNSIIKIISTSNLKVSLDFITRYKENISQKLISYYYAKAYEFNGLRKEAIEMYRSVIDILSSEEKVYLAELLLFDRKGEEAYKILEQTYEIDPWSKNLMKALIKTSKSLGSVEYEKWIEEAINNNHQDEYVLQEIGNFLMNNGRFSDASITWRKLYNVTQNPYFEMMDRYSYVYDKAVKRETAEEVLQDVARNYPQLQDEVFFRLGLVCLNKYDSPLKSFQYLSKMSNDSESKIAFDGALLRMKILQDPNTSVRALGKIKPFQNENHADRLANTIVDELIKDIYVLANNDVGYLKWGNYIERAQSEESWREHLSIKLSKELAKWVAASITPREESLSEDKTEGISVKNIIGSLRLAKTGIPQELEIDEQEFTENAIKVLSAVSTVYDQLLGRYEASIILSLVGKNQLANDHALTILQLSSRINDDHEREVTKILGLVAWGNSQYRLGNYIEGLSCLISVIPFALKLSLIQPLMDSSNIITRWVIEHGDIFTDADKKNASEFISKFGGVTEDGVFAIESSMLQGDWNSAYQLLKPRVEKYDFSSEWASHFVNLIAALVRLDRGEEAVELINKYYNEAIIGMEKRKDIRFRALLSWSQILFFNMSKLGMEAIRLAVSLLTTAIQDVEIKRQSVHHKTERAAITVEANDVYKLYLDMQGIIYVTEGFNPEEKHRAKLELIKMFAVLSPRTLIEQLDYSSTSNSEIDDLKLEYDVLFDEVSRIQDYRLEENIKKIKYFNSIKEQLTKIHPHFQALPLFTIKDINEVRGVMESDEVFFQYIITSFGVVTLLVDNESESITYALGKVTKIEYLDELLFQQLSIQPNDETEEQIKKICSELSSAIFGSLVHRLQAQDIKKVYVSPDITLKAFSTSLIRFENEWVISKLDNISNIIDMGYLLRNTSKKSETNKTLLAIGAPNSGSDAAIPRAKSFAQSNTSNNLIILEDFGKHNSELFSTCETVRPKTLAIIAHGVPDPNSDLYNGAFSVHGKDVTLSADDISDLCDYTDELILFTCRSGNAVGKHLESSTGILSFVLGKKIGSMILCKWDVDVRPCLELLGQFSLDENNEKPLYMLLGSGQKELIKSKDYSHPVYWAGFELWGKNEDR
ncbi:CHAT domain-containing tetratricopeptide repeat protein [Paenibacillus chitinolyticus]|uniref:CHAT domain-containing tetratricopeptide repeat protein n=1 Tax=Paenibacillus chitinolyticus TaxID=79263 RepID=UPI003626766D